MIDFKKLGNRSSIVQLEPRDIFMSLPSRNELYKYPRDVQSEVWIGYNKVDTFLEELLE